MFRGEEASRRRYVIVPLSDRHVLDCKLDMLIS